FGATPCFGATQGRQASSRAPQKSQLAEFAKRDHVVASPCRHTSTLQVSTWHGISGPGSRLPSSATATLYTITAGLHDAASLHQPDRIKPASGPSTTGPI